MNSILIGILLVIVVLVVAFVLFGQLISDARIRALERDYSKIKDSLTNMENIQIDQCATVHKKLDIFEADISTLKEFHKDQL